MQVRPWSVALLLGWAAALGAQAVPCANIYEMEHPKDTYYVVAFLDLPSSLAAADREQARERLQDLVTPVLNDYTRTLSKRTGSPRYRLELVGCDGPLRSGDLNRNTDLQDLLQMRVIAVLWRGSVAGRPGLVHLALPMYQRQPALSRQEAEVVTVHASQAGNAVDAWAEVLPQAEASYRSFAALGLGVALFEKNDLLPAWVALCESRSALAATAASALRPPPAEAQALLGSFVGRTLQDIELAAHGSAVANNAVLRQVCAIP